VPGWEVLGSVAFELDARTYVRLFKLWFERSCRMRVLGEREERLPTCRGTVNSCQKSQS